MAKDFTPIEVLGVNEDNPVYGVYMCNVIDEISPA